MLRKLLLFSFFTTAFHSSSIPSAHAQIAELPPAILDHLNAPEYPAIAQSARVAGDVKLVIAVLPDGIVANAKVVSGPPLLANAALTSARNSKFQCQNCGSKGASYSLTYTFGLREDIDCTVKSLRVGKCLYLWKCGWRNPMPRPTDLRQLPGRVTLLADARCIETISAKSSPARSSGLQNAEAGSSR